MFRLTIIIGSGNIRMSRMNVQTTSRRCIKPRTQYSPSDPVSVAVYHLVNYDDTRTMMIIANSSIKRSMGDDTVVLNDNRTAKVITSGKFLHFV